MVCHIHVSLYSRIDDEFVVKVADFGLSKHLTECTYVSSEEGKRRKMPIKWMALESLEEMVFTVKTDVVRSGLLNINSVKTARRTVTRVQFPSPMSCKLCPAKDINAAISLVKEDSMVVSRATADLN